MSNKAKLSETNEEQVLRVLEAMVASGEVIKQYVDGEFKYSLAPKTRTAKTFSTKAKVTKVKTKAKKKNKANLESLAFTRSQAAVKAWKTRRAIYSEEELFNIQSKAAKKAWETMRGY
jgi:hypothetical protein